VRLSHYAGPKRSDPFYRIAPLLCERALYSESWLTMSNYQKVCRITVRYVRLPDSMVRLGEGVGMASKFDPYIQCCSPETGL
jgi:hypothetical protein